MKWNEKKSEWSAKSPFMPYLKNTVCAQCLMLNVCYSQINYEREKERKKRNIVCKYTLTKSMLFPSCVQMFHSLHRFCRFRFGYFQYRWTGFNSKPKQRRLYKEWDGKMVVCFDVLVKSFFYFEFFFLQR